MDQRGGVVTDPDLINDLSNIKIPKTYTNVQLYPDARNKLRGQAIDGKGTVQYFYSEKHKRNASREKNCNLIFFGQTYPHILEDIQSILSDKNASDDLKLHALALRIMSLCHFRAGSQKNVRENGTYGLTTLKHDHLSLNDNTARISFVGKKKQLNTCLIKDPVTVAFLRNLEKAKGQDSLLLTTEAFKVTPESLNNFLKTYHESISTKTWRTWFANLKYIESLNDAGIIPATVRERKLLSNNIIRSIAEELHHTLAINKRNYLIPELESLFIENPKGWMELNELYPNDTDFLLAFLTDYCSGSLLFKGFSALAKRP